MSGAALEVPLEWYRDGAGEEYASYAVRRE